MSEDLLTMMQEVRSRIPQKYWNVFNGNFVGVLSSALEEQGIEGRMVWEYALGKASQFTQETADRGKEDGHVAKRQD